MSNKLKSIVIDDEPKSREVLIELINLFCPDVEVIDEAGNITEAIEKIKLHRPALVFFDILLQEGDSFEIIKGLDKVDFDMIFVTAFDEGSVQALKFSGARVLLKPIQILELTEAVEAVKKQKGQSLITYKMADGMLNSQFTKLPLITTSGIEFKEINEVILITKTSKGSIIRFENEQEIVSERSIEDLSPFFDMKVFERISEDYIVNKQYIELHDKRNQRILLRSGEELHYGR